MPLCVLDPGQLLQIARIVVETIAVSVVDLMALSDLAPVRVLPYSSVEARSVLRNE